MAAGIDRVRGHGVTLLSAVFGLCAAAVFVTFSRSAALALLAGTGLAVVLLFAGRHWRSLGNRLVACLVAALLIAPFLLPFAPYLGARVNPGAQQAGSTEERAISERQALAKNTNEIFIERPLTGTGIGGLPTAMFHDYPGFRYHYSPAHVVLLVVAAESGIFGAFAYAVLMLAPWLLAWWHRNDLGPEQIGTLAALLALSIVSMLDYYTWSLTSGRIWFWLVLALWLVTHRRDRENARNA
jgi:hypothetical protein